MNRAKRPKILYTTAEASPQSGAYRSLLYMNRGIEKWGYESALVLPEGNGPHDLLTAEEHRRVYTLPLPRPKLRQPMGYYFNYFRHNARSTGKFVGIIRQEQASVVHINEILDLYAAVAARMAGVPCVCHVRAHFPSGVGLLFHRMAVLLSNAIVTVSGSVYERMFREKGIDTRKVSTIHNPGPDFAEFHPGVHGASVRREFSLDGGTFLVVLVAKLHEGKGHEILVRAVPQVLASFPNTHFMIVGGELAGPHHREYATKLKALPRELGVQEKVIFTGYRADIPQIMATSDIVTHCSIYPDPFPGVVLQGMAVGKPVIASDIGGPKEQIENHISGLLVEPGNPTALAGAICSLLGDEEERARLGEAAARRVRSTFTPELFFRKLSDLYDGLISRS